MSEFDNLGSLPDRLPAPATKGAEFSPCRTYRYSLYRAWPFYDPLAEKTRLVVIALNPSTADETQDDPTIRRCIGFAKAWGHGSLVMLNLFAYRSTDPAGLKSVADPVGPDNDRIIAEVANPSCFVLAAWGTKGGYRGRSEAVIGLLRRNAVPLYCLRKTKAGHPEHPLYCPAATKPIQYP